MECLKSVSGALTSKTHKRKINTNWVKKTYKSNFNNYCYIYNYLKCKVKDVELEVA
jgi:hypothetical protein